MLYTITDINELQFGLKEYQTTIEKQASDILELRATLVSSIQDNIEMYDFSPNNYLTIDTKFVIQRINLSAALLIGVDRHKLIDKLFLKFITVDSKHKLSQSIETLLNTSFSQECEIELLQKIDHKKYVVLNITLLTNKLIRLCLRDITQLKQLVVENFELKKSLSIINKLFQNSSDAIASLNSEWVIKAINTPFIQLFSKIFTKKIDVGIRINAFMNDLPEMKTKIMTACQESIQGRHTSILLESNNDDPSYYCYELDVNCFYNEYEKKNSLILRIKNLTNYKLEDNLQHKKQSDIAIACRISTMGGMASAFAHEINQPLTAIIAYSRTCLYLIKNNDMPTKTLCSLLYPLEQMSSQAELAGSIIHNMGNVVHEGNTQIEQTNINALIKETLSIFTYETYDFKFKISLDLMDNISDTMANKIHIMQVVLNLTRNSIEALQNASTIKPELIIKTYEANGNIEVHVIDNGPGIPIKYQDVILNTYFTTKTHGTGIGLGVCRSLIEAHGGRLCVHPQINSGAWFMFTLPII